MWKKACNMRTLMTKHKKGSVLIIAMWALSVLTLFAVMMGVDSRGKMTFVGKIGDRDRLRYIAEAGIEKAIIIIAAKGPNPAYDQISDLGGIGTNRYVDKKIGNGECYVGYDYLDTDSEKIKRWYGVSDCESRISLNKAGYKEISAIIKITTDLDKKNADDLAAAIVDWRDKDDFPLFNGVESRYYMSLKDPYPSKNSEFEVLSELFLVRGMTKEIYESIIPYVTIYGSGKININTARETVLAALGLNKTLVRKIMKFRAGMDREEGTYDDNIFTTAGTITAELSQAISVSAEEVALLSNLSSAGILSTVSGFFEIRSVGRVGTKDQVLEVVCVYDRAMVDSGENAIKYWHERYQIDPLPKTEVNGETPSLRTPKG
ncbi:MAG: hypothetical protein ABH862_03370 [Candidatus Omnitrophota bacterium]